MSALKGFYVVKFCFDFIVISQLKYVLRFYDLRQQSKDLLGGVVTNPEEVLSYSRDQ